MDQNILLTTHPEPSKPHTLTLHPTSGTKTSPRFPLEQGRPSTLSPQTRTPEPQTPTDPTPYIRDENIALLQKHGFDLEKALEELLN
eukprot:CAMPEP_0180159562 /NCGR_PEP_ID=MMETSP0986-20121125/27590_1 /TAXON_ID=697907 /ORGANISM="non described non described, Strain CCMP2293" /LENGTH=86 /DNA_ID=CAMNT_0022109655 /DNA_START=339 /DNA_END=600 /DNA_ORIENTATION=+